VREEIARDRRVRPRPRLHFTAQDGWINDPYGIAWFDGRYHLYYQAVPGQVVWGPGCRWGHAESPDLVRWEERPPALVPQEYEVGCWSGSVVHTATPPTILYTRVAGPDLQLGQVATASLDPSGRWRSTLGDVVVEGPPADLGVLGFRDPFVFAYDEGWVMLMGAGLPQGTAAVLQYRSVDLRSWSYEGILCSRRSDPADDVWTGSLWECPQLFPLGDDWVLVVSVWEADTLHHVAAAVGDYDGRTFRPRSWQQLTYGACAYAMSAFLDRDGRRCVMSWLREEPQPDEALAQRAGAHSVVSTLELDGAGTLVMRPHPALDGLRGEPLAGAVVDGGLRYDVGDSTVELTLTAVPGQRCEIAEGGRVRATLARDDAQPALLIERPGLSRQVLPLPDSDPALRVLLDADILEVFSAGTYGAYRIAPALDASATALVLGRHGGQHGVVRRLRS
jgi:beta-fructofuranosidase